MHGPVSEHTKMKKASVPGKGRETGRDNDDAQAALDKIILSSGGREMKARGTQKEEKGGGAQTCQGTHKKGKKAACLGKKDGWAG